MLLYAYKYFILLVDPLPPITVKYCTQTSSITRDGTVLGCLVEAKRRSYVLPRLFIMRGEVATSSAIYKEF